MTVVKNVAWFDVDDVLLDFIGGFNTYLQTKGIKIDKDYLPKEWNYTCVFSEPNGAKEHIDTFIREGCGNLDMLGKARYMLQMAKKNDWEVNLITAFPAVQMMERLNNLSSLGLNFDHYYSTFHYDHLGTPHFIDKCELIEKLRYNQENIFNMLVDDRHVTVRKFIKKIKTGAGVTVPYSYNDASILEHAKFDTHEEKKRIKLASCGTNKNSAINDMHDLVIDLILSKRI